MADDAIKELHDQVAVLTSLHAYRTRPLPKFGKFDADDKATNVQRQLDDIHTQMGVVSCVLNELMQIIKPLKTLTQ